MKCSDTHIHSEHSHGPDCGHTAIRHNNHVDYLCDGYLHHPHGDHCDQHVMEVNDVNPDKCTPLDECGDHIHGPDCGHEAVTHGDHVDYIVNGRLHHVHNGHCDDHGPVDIVLG